MKKVFAALCLLFASLCLHAQVKVYVHLDTSIHKSFTGRLVLLTQNDTSKGVGDGNGVQASFAKNITNWQPGQVQVFDNSAEASGPSLDKLPAGYYKLAAVMHLQGEGRDKVPNAGNAYSRKEFILHVNENASGEQHVYINSIFQERSFRETARIKLLQLKSELLSTFHRKTVSMQAAVILPDSVEPGKKYPVVFIIPGWGGTHFDAMNASARARYGIGKGLQKIYVYLNPETQTRWGLHAFVDSDVNGPWGKALVEELIPYLKTQYPVSLSADNYFVMGQSSGGYGAAWLQLHYPQAFNGCWAVSPDPVDFSNFTGVNLYDPAENMYFDREGKERGLYFIAGKAQSTLRQVCTGDEFAGDGSQQQSFEAEFGKAGSDGRPRLLFNRLTGVIDRTVVNDWKSHDLGLYVHQHWSSLAPALSGKVHVYAGAQDNFLLNNAVMAFAAKAKSVNADLVAELIPGADHWSIWSPAFTERVQWEIDARVK